MSNSPDPPEGRYVKGSLLLDFTNMVEANPELPWSEYLTPEDLELVKQIILPASWYPIESFQRIGLATFKLVAKGNYAITRAYGRSLADKLSEEYPAIICKGRARTTIERHRAIHQRLYSFEISREEEIAPGHLIVHVFTEPEDVGVRQMMEIIAGTVERLIELSGGRNIEVKTTEAVWEGAEKSAMEIKWEE